MKTTRIISDPINTLRLNTFGDYDGDETLNHYYGVTFHQLRRKLWIWIRFQHLRRNTFHNYTVMPDGPINTATISAFEHQLSHT